MSKVWILLAVLLAGCGSAVARGTMETYECTGSTSGDMVDALDEAIPVVMLCELREDEQRHCNGNDSWILGEDVLAVYCEAGNTFTVVWLE